MTNQRGIVSILITSMLGICFWQSKVAADEMMIQSDTVFNDPAHAEYFRFEEFLVAHGQKGETKESWDQLPADSRVKKVSEGERTLSALKNKFLGKMLLDTDELEMFASVWGNTETAPDTKSSAISDEGSAVFSKYQVYRAKHAGEESEQQSLDNISEDVRVKKIADGLFFLDSLKKELANKAILTAQESELFGAIWGNSSEAHATQESASATDKTKDQPHQPQRKSFNTEAVNAVKSILQKYQQNDNWSGFFDGAKLNTADAVGLISKTAQDILPINLSSNSMVIAETAVHQTTHLTGQGVYGQAVNESQISTVSASNSKLESGNIADTPRGNLKSKSTPVSKNELVFGAVLLVLGTCAFGLKKFTSKSMPGVATDISESDDFPAIKLLQNRIDEKLGPEPKATIDINPVSSRTCSGCEGTCNNTCAGGCKGSCSSVCADDCHGSCRGSCSVTCADTCHSNCYGGCDGTCTGRVRALAAVLASISLPQLGSISKFSHNA
ncbi:MAG: hypothetical protein WC421_09050 [Elusimicrobiales bacterium]